MRVCACMNMRVCIFIANTCSVMFKGLFVMFVFCGETIKPSSLNTKVLHPNN